MKNALYLIAGLFFTLFTSCGSNNNLQERPPAQFNDVYYTKDANGMSLYIPVAVIQDERVSLDAVYFKGLKSILQKDPEKANLYVANFRTGMGDVVMHKDPRKEYGNQAPQMPEKSPVSLNDNEALLVFTQDGETKYYKLKGIVEKEKE